MIILKTSIVHIVSENEKMRSKIGNKIKDCSPVDLSIQEDRIRETTRDCDVLI